MRPAHHVMLLLLSGFPLAGCTPAVVVPDQDRLRVTQELSGRKRWLAVSLNVGPFFADRARLLGSDQPFAELELLETPGGRTIAPPRPERVLPPGTPVTLREVEFPSPWLIARRVVMTPRYQPWLWLEVAGEPRPVVVVLPQGLASFEDVRVELDRYLSNHDNGADLAALPEPQRRAVERKEVVEGMGPAAVTMAWGYPEKRIVDRPAAREQWIWPGGRRKGWFEDDRLTRFEAR
jgi:hypothetical protein